MPTENQDFYTKKHKKLDGISFAAAIFAWLVLISFIFVGLVECYSTFIRLNSEGPLGYLFRENPISVISSFFSPITTLFQAGVYWLVLKGVSLGLNMIIETDLNYRMNASGNNHE